MPEVRLIDANCVSSEMTAAYYENPQTEDEKIYNLALTVAKKLIRKAPTIEAEPVKHGRWIPTEYDSYADGAPVWDKYECSECGHEHEGEEDTLKAFCPDCGADMRGGADDAGRK